MSQSVSAAQEFTDYRTDLIRLIAEVKTEEVEAIAHLLVKTWKEGKMLLIMGNGGSSSSASHIVADLQKCVQIDTGKALRAICLTDPTPLVTAWANDTAWDNIFTPQVECWAENTGAVISISGSGNSMNVVNATKRAQELKIPTIGFIGFKGGKLDQYCDHHIIVESHNMQRIEDVHMMLLHAIFDSVRKIALTHS